MLGQGKAYEAADGSGVYFDVSTLPSYGKLRRLQPVQDAEDDEEQRGKRSARDFALWKPSSDASDEDAVWESPWGVGRPGWHIECSAIAHSVFGEGLDLHTGASQRWLVMV